MDQIRLPMRAVATRTSGVLGVTVCAMALVLGCAGWMMYDEAATVLMTKFRTVVSTRLPILDYVNQEVQAEWTLFQEGGRRHALKPSADRALGLDTLDGEMRYVYARALWREYNSPVDATGRTTGGFLHDELLDLVVRHLRTAIRLDPANCFYRSTLAGVLRTTETRNAEVKPEIAHLLLSYPPQDTYGMVRTGELLSAEGGEKSQVQADYCRGLSLVSAEVSSGLVDPTVMEAGVPVYPALGPLLVKRAVTDLLRDIGPYDRWAGTLPDGPETRWLVAGELRSRGMNAEADKEYAKVVEVVQRRLAAERAQSVFRTALESLWPLGSSGSADRFLMNREIGLAANVLRSTGRAEEAIGLLEVEISRAPREVGPRLVLGDLLLEQAAVYKAAARDFTEKKEAAKAAEADNKAEAMYEGVDQQASAILDRQPQSSEALVLRARIPKRTPERSTP